MPDLKNHWESVYRLKPANAVSWYQVMPALSLRLIENTGIGKDAAIIDVGGGVSGLSAALCEAGYRNLSVLDISANALAQAKQMTRQKACDLRVFEADVTEFEPPVSYDLWHDRAVFHFLVDEHDRRAYVSVLKRALAPGSHLVMLTFAKDGPLKCSGLDVMQYNAEGIQAVLGRDFQLVESGTDMHTTPMGAHQKFAFFRFIYQPTA
jgi:SAM-dependent methyltransferase